MASYMTSVGEHVQCCWDAHRTVGFNLTCLPIRYGGFCLLTFFVRAGEFFCLCEMNSSLVQSSCGVALGGLVFK